MYLWFNYEYLPRYTIDFQIDMTKKKLNFKHDM